FAALYGLEVATARDGRFRAKARTWQARLARLGRASLFIYWIHVELVYGYASWLWRHRLPLWATALASAVFCLLIYEAVGLRDRFVTRWRSRGQTGRRAATATA